MQLRKFTDIVVFGSFYISACACALVLSSWLIFNRHLNDISLPLLVFVFFSTLSIYNLPSLFFSSYPVGMENSRQGWIVRHRRSLRLLVFFSVFMMLWSFMQLSSLSRLLLLPLAVLSLLYSIPEKIYNRKIFSLRRIPALKIFLIAGVWAAVTVFLPAFENKEKILWERQWHLFLERFFFIVTITIPFDIRDLRQDKRSQLITLPHLLGVKKVKYLSFIFLFLYMLSSLIYYPDVWIITARGATVLCAGYIISKVKVNSTPYYFLVCVDGIMLLQFLFLVLFLLL